MALAEEDFNAASGTIVNGKALTGGTTPGVWAGGGGFQTTAGGRGQNTSATFGNRCWSTTLPAAPNHKIAWKWFTNLPDTNTTWSSAFALGNGDNTSTGEYLSARLICNGSVFTAVSLVYNWLGTTQVLGTVTLTNAAGREHIPTGATINGRMEVSYAGSGNTLNVKVFAQRTSPDTNWIDTSGVWQTAEQPVIDVNWDTTGIGGIGILSLPGLCGIATFQNANAGAQLDDFQILNAATLAVSPTSVVVGSTTNLALTGTDTAWTPGTPGVPDFSVSGTGTENSQVVATTTTATLNYTAPAAAGTVTITDPSSGATTNLTILAGLTPGTLTVNRNNGGSGPITLESTATTGNVSPSGSVTLQLVRSVVSGDAFVNCTLIDTKTGTGAKSWVDNTALPDTVYYYYIRVSDPLATPTTADSNQAEATIEENQILMVVAGDSNIATHAGTQALVTLRTFLASALGPRADAPIANGGVSGATMSSFMSGQPNMTALLALAAGKTHCLVMLGTNMEGGVDLTAKLLNYRNAAINVIATLRGAGLIVLLAGPPYSQIPAYANWVAGCRDVLKELHSPGTGVYFIADEQMRLGAGSYATGATPLFESDDIHYLTTATVSNMLAYVLGYAILRSAFDSSGGSGGSGGAGGNIPIMVAAGRKPIVLGEVLSPDNIGFVCVTEGTVVFTDRMNNVTTKAMVAEEIEHTTPLKLDPASTGTYALRMRML